MQNLLNNFFNYKKRYKMDNNYFDVIKFHSIHTYTNNTIMD